MEGWTLRAGLINDQQTVQSLTTDESFTSSQDSSVEESSQEVSPTLTGIDVEAKTEPRPHVEAVCQWKTLPDGREQCPWCGRSMKDLPGLKDHVNKHHFFIKDKKLLAQMGLVLCPWNCGTAVRQPHGLVIHQMRYCQFRTFPQNSAARLC